MKENLFINRLKYDWIPKKRPKQKTTKTHNDDWAWFFKDSDHDGLMNGVDCKPYNKKKQDAFINLSSPGLQQSTPMLAAANTGMSTGAKQVPLTPENKYFLESSHPVKLYNPTNVSIQSSPKINLSSPPAQQIKGSVSSQQVNLSSSQQPKGSVSSSLQQVNLSSAPQPVQQQKINVSQAPQSNVFSTIRQISNQSPSFLAQSNKIPSDTRTYTPPDLRTNEEKLQSARQNLAGQLEATAIAGSALVGPIALPALGAAATPLHYGTIGMLEGEAIGGLHSVAQTGKIDTKDIAKNVAIGGVTGFVTSYVPAKVAAILTTQKPQFAEYTINEQNKDLVPLLKDEKIRVPSKFETGIMEKISGTDSTNQLGGWHLKPINQTVIPQENATPEVVAHESIHGLLEKTKFSDQTISNLAGQAVADDAALAKNAPSPGFLQVFSGKQPGMLKQMVDMTGGYKGNAANEEIIARFVNLYPQEVAHPTTQTGAFLNQLFVNRGILPTQQVVQAAAPTVQTISQKLGTTLQSMGSTNLTQTELSKRLESDIAQSSGPTVQSITQKLGNTLYSIGSAKLTPAETAVMEKAITQKLGLSVAAGVGLGIGGMIRNNPMELGSSVKSQERVTTQQTKTGVGLPQEKPSTLTIMDVYMTKSNKPFIIDYSSGREQIKDLEGNIVQPVYNKNGGGLTDILRADLPKNAVNSIQKGFNEKAVETVYDLNPLYATKDGKVIAAKAAEDYLKKEKITLYEPNIPERGVDKYGGYWKSEEKKIYISPNSQKNDRNGVLIHETEHAIQNSQNDTTANDIYYSIKDQKPIISKQANITGYNPQTNLIAARISDPIYKYFDKPKINNEIKSYYVEQYYDRLQPRNDIVDSFEKTLGINTTPKLTPDQNKQFNNAMDTLIKHAQDTNDTSSGIFKPINKNESFMRINV